MHKKKAVFENLIHTIVALVRTEQNFLPL